LLNAYGVQTMAKPLSFGQLLTIMLAAFTQLPDKRTGKNSQYAMSDAALGAFSVFFTQSPSFLAHQRHMQRRRGQNNAQSLFGVEHIPTDPQIRNLLDPVAPDHLRAPFWGILARLEQAGYLDTDYRFEDMLLCSLDGTQYFSSTQIHCPQCTVTMRGDTAHYAHTVLLPALVRPGKAEVIALEPEFITPQDGAEKQDCERNAAHRWLERTAPQLAERRVTLLADDLHCNQPFCEKLVAHQIDFIMTCKPDSHLALYTEVALLDGIQAVRHLEDRRWTGKGYERWTYRFVNQVPLRAGAEPLLVNWCELIVVNEATDQELYHNAFATSHELREDTVRTIVTAGRARWKIENENNNVLKNHGYHLEHNYGHGRQHLSTVLVMLALLAFLFHTVLQLADRKYQRVRAELATRRTFFDDIRALTRYLLFESWEHLLDFMMTQLELGLD
jgi:hypothetical protein